MVKKKSKKDQELSTSNVSSFLDSRTGKASVVLMGTLVAEILSIALDHLLQKSNAANNASSVEQNTTATSEDSKGLIGQTVSDAGDQIHRLKPKMQDAAEATKSVISDAPSNMAQVVEAVKEKVPAIASSIISNGSLAQLTVGDVVDTAKTVAAAFGTSASEALPKKGKKKHKK